MSTVALSLDDLDVQRIADAVAQRLLAEHRPSKVPATRPAPLTVREAAAALRCSERQVHRLIASGQLRASKLSKTGSSRRLIARSEVDRLCEVER